ncbi:hypothetical protein FACS189426_11200 [Bacteroidia bacterium]|nr:hypothetical protein FACS189426_11200 [Bacteroidia bacterium]
MGTITLTYNERNVQVMNLLNYILASGLLVTINPLLFLAESFIIERFKNEKNLSGLKDLTGF